MAEMAQVPADWFAVFQHDNLPGHPHNVLINHPGQARVNPPPAPENEEIDWPEINGVRAMPMSGRFLVRGADRVLRACENGYLIVGPDGHPQWVAEPG